MKNIKVSALKPGMKFSEPVYFEGSNLLVPKGVPLRPRDIDQLQRWKILEVQTDGEAVFPGNTVPERDKPEKPADIPVVLQDLDTENILEKYASIVEEIQDLFERIKKQEEVNVVRIDMMIDAIFSMLKEDRDASIRYILSGDQQGHNPPESALNTTVLSILIGMNMKLANHKLIQLATAALLHDVGMLLVPESLLAKKGNLLPEDMEKIRRHPVHTYRIVTKVLKYPEEIGRMALEHHERWDGEGYPERKKGSAIHLHARIIAVTDAFEAMVRSRPYRSPMIAYTAMRNILSDNSRRFDPDVLKVFLQSLGIYPIGSVVLLSDSRIGRVISINTDAPLRPRLKLLSQKSGDSSEEAEIVDLKVDKHLFIVKALNPRDLTARNSPPRHA